MAVRWTFNVIPDELLRMSASGVASPLYHPAQYMAYLVGNKGDFALTGDRFSDTLIASEMGAGYAQNLTEVAQRGYIGDVRRAPWVPYAEGEIGHYDAWAGQIVRLWADEFTRRSLTFDSVDDAMDFFQNTAEGQELVTRIIGGARENTRLSQLADPNILRDHLEQVNARVHQYAGGTWVGFDVNDRFPGQWVDVNGNVVPAPEIDYLGNRWDGRSRWVVTQAGDEHIRDIIATGRVKTGGNFVTDSGEVIPATRPILWRGSEPGGKLLHTPRKTRRLGLAQVDRLKDELKAAKRRWAKAENAGIVSPSVPKYVRGQDPRLVRRLDSAYSGFIDSAFAVLGQAPTMVLSRSPYFRQTYWREVARQYMNATPDVRRVIDKWAKEGGMTAELNRWVAEDLRMAGWKTLPEVPAGYGWDKADELNDWAKAVGLDQTKNLLYDLSESHNIGDMNRNLVVFAEAWWEIISRWAHLLFNPKTRSMFNWEKMRQMGMFAQREGFMSDNEYGQTVFNYPSLGLTVLGQQDARLKDVRLGTNISTNQLLSNPLAQLGGGQPGTIRSIMAPGFSPIIQIAAPPLAQVLPPEWRDAFGKTITGEFPMADSMMEAGFNSLPTSFKNALSLIDTDLGAAERRFNTNVSTALETLAVSGSYDFSDPDARQDLERDAINLGRTLTIARLFDSLFAPESPRYVPELLDKSIQFGQHHYISAAALGAALDYAEELFRDPLAASAYVAAQYGLDPLNLEGANLPKTRIIKQRPVTFQAFTWMQNHQDIYDDYPYTAFAYGPDNPNEDFWLPAWYDQLASGDTRPLTPEEQVAVLNNRQASLKYDAAQTYAEQQMEAQVKARPESESVIRKRWEEWLQSRRNDIEAEHIGWSRAVMGIDAHYTPGPATPEYGDVYDDFNRAVIRDAEGTVIGIDPRLAEESPVTAEFVRGFMSAFDLARADSVARGNDPDTWLGSTADWAVGWQRSIAEDAQTYVNRVRMAGGDTIGIEWIIRRWLDPVMKGVDMGTPFITDTAQGEAPAYRADTARDMIGGP